MPFSHTLVRLIIVLFAPVTASTTRLRSIITHHQKALSRFSLLSPLKAQQIWLLTVSSAAKMMKMLAWASCRNGKAAVLF
jgi:hypothetical protein